MPPLSGGRRFPLHGAPSLATREGDDTLAAGRRGGAAGVGPCPVSLAFGPRQFCAQRPGEQ